MVTAMRFRRVSGPSGSDDPDAAAEEDVYELEPGALASVFTAPRWLRDLGIASWLIVGFVRSPSARRDPPGRTH